MEERDHRRLHVPYRVERDRVDLVHDDVEIGAPFAVPFERLEVRRYL